MTDLAIQDVVDAFAAVFKKLKRVLVVVEDTLRMIFADLGWMLEDLMSTPAWELLRYGLHHGREEGTETMNDQSIHMNTEYRVRLKGKDNGGWKGDPDHFGTFAICGNPEGEKILALNVPSVSPRGVKYTIEGIAQWPQVGESQKEIAIDVETKGGYTHRFRFEIHRDDHPKLVSYLRQGDEIGMSSSILAEMGIDSVLKSPTNLLEEKAQPVVGPHESTAHGISSFSMDIDAAMEKIPCEISDEGRELMATFEGLLNTPPENRYGPRSKAYAMALIRHAVQNPGKPVDIRPPTFLSTNRILRNLVGGLLDITGLREYATMGTNAIVVYRPDELEGDAAYAYGRAREPFLADPTDFNMPIAVPLKPSEKVRADKNELPGYDEALALSKAVNRGDGDDPKGALQAGF